MIFVEIFVEMLGASLFTAALCVRSRMATLAFTLDDGNARSASQCDLCGGCMLVLKRFCIIIEIFFGGPACFNVCVEAVLHVWLYVWLYVCVNVCVNVCVEAVLCVR